jgi:hypothetical protein
MRFTTDATFDGEEPLQKATIAARTAGAETMRARASEQTIASVDG